MKKINQLHKLKLKLTLPYIKLHYHQFNRVIFEQHDILLNHLHNLHLELIMLPLVL